MSQPDSLNVEHGDDRAVASSQQWLLGAWTARVLLGIVITVILGQALDAAAFGFYALVSTIILLGHILMDFGSGSVAVRQIAQEPGEEKRLLSVVLGFRHLAGAAAATACAVMALTMDGERQVVLIVAAGTIFASAWGSLSAVMTVRQRQAAMQSLGVGSQALLAMGVVILVEVEAPHLLFAILPCARDLLNTVGTAVLAVKRLGYCPRPRIRNVGLSPFLKVSMFQGLAVIVQTAYFHVDVVLVRVLRGEAELGAYAAAFRPINPLLLLPGALVIPLLPVLARTAAHDRPRFARYVDHGGALLLSLGLIGGIFGWLLSPELLQLLYRGQYTTGPLDSTLALRWLTCAFVAVFATAPLATALLADGRERALLKIALGGLVVNVIGNLLLLPRMGFEAAALTTALTEVTVFLTVAGSVLLRPGLSGLRPRISALLPSLLLIAILIGVPATGTSRVVVGGCGALIAALIVVLGPVGRRFRSALSDV